MIDAMDQLDVVGYFEEEKYLSAYLLLDRAIEMD